MIIVDSREKKHQHIINYMVRNSMPFEVRKLDIADYMLEGYPKNVVDRKQNLDELIHNLFSKDKRRFIAELQRARASGTKITIVCEHGQQIGSIADVVTFKSQYSKITGRQLRGAIERIRLAYGVDFVFCDKRSTGKVIMEILGGNKND